MNPVKHLIRSLTLWTPWPQNGAKQKFYSRIPKFSKKIFFLAETRFFRNLSSSEVVFVQEKYFFSLLPHFGATGLTGTSGFRVLKVTYCSISLTTHRSKRCPHPVLYTILYTPANFGALQLTVSQSSQISPWTAEILLLFWKNFTKTVNFLSVFQKISWKNQKLHLETPPLDFIRVYTALYFLLLYLAF